MIKKFRVTVNGTSYDVEIESLDGEEDYGPISHGIPLPSMASSPLPASPAASIPKAETKIVDIHKKEVISPIAGTLTEMKVQVGSMVKENEVVAVIEAMKMNTHIHSPISGKIKTIHVNPGNQIKQGQVLVTFE